MVALVGVRDLRVQGDLLAAVGGVGVDVLEVNADAAIRVEG